MYKRILFPVDIEHTKEAKKALKIAIEEARQSKAKITVMTVAPGFGMPIVASYFDEKIVKQALKEVARHLKVYVEKNIPDDIASAAVVMEGNPAELILAQARKIKADLIVIPSHITPFENIFLGSCSAKVVRHSQCSVMVVK